MAEFKLVTADGQTLTTAEGFTGTAKSVTYPNGDTYAGDFEEGQRCGDKGTYTYAAAAEGAEVEKYEGAWSGNQKHGIDKQNYAGLGQYYGHWENGEKHGEGVMIYTNKDIYSGQWKDGKKHGQGTYIFEETKEKFVGQFRAGNIVQGRWYYPNGTYFEGNFDNNMPKGTGKWHFHNGNTV